MPIPTLGNPQNTIEILKKYNFSNMDDLYSAVGFGSISTNKIIVRLRDEYAKTVKPEDLDKNLAIAKEFVSDKPKKEKSAADGIVVKGIDNCLVRLSKCCNPVPGDSIVGYITRGRGVSVHRSDCVNILSGLDSEARLIEVSWTNAPKTSYPADLIIVAIDRNMLLIEIMNQISDSNLTLRAINAKVNKEGNAIINVTLDIQDTVQLDRIINKLLKVSGVMEVNRIKH